MHLPILLSLRIFCRTFHNNISGLRQDRAAAIISSKHNLIYSPEKSFNVSEKCLKVSFFIFLNMYRNLQYQFMDCYIDLSLKRLNIFLVC